MELLEKQRLSAYAVVANQKIFASQADLDPKDQADSQFLLWCRTQQSLVIMQSGVIYTSDPASRAVQNAKRLMQEKKCQTTAILPASQELIELLLTQANTSITSAANKTVSAQQQRLRDLIQDALALGVSDIHIEIRTETALIRFRKHGELYVHAEWLPKLAKEIASVAFNKETDHSVTHFNPLVPQSASMPLVIGDREVRLRLATLPAHGGYDVVLRILAVADEDVPQLHKLGYNAQQVSLIKRAAKLPHGAVIFAGPTGSGKTTSLASLMQYIQSSRKLYSIEDPVEKVVQTATQVPVNTDHYDRSFASMARTVLRMDPDVVVLGEIRDEDTAAVMIRAAITGHLIFSTLHTHSATEIVTRLQNFGVGLNILASPELLSCLVCQRLYPVLCQSCAEPFIGSAYYLQNQHQWDALFGADSQQVKMRGDGCADCDHLGITGRSVVAEVIWIDDKGRQFIRNQDMLGWKQYLKAQHWQSMREQVIQKVCAGVCDPMAAETLLGDLGAAEVFDYAGVQ